MDTVLQVMEIVSLVVGVLIVLCLIKEKLLAWPLGVLFVFLTVPVLYNQNLFGYVALSLLGFLPLNLYGWYYWVFGNKDKEELPVTRANVPTLVALVFICIVGVILLPYLFELVIPNYEEAALPYLDNSIFMMSFGAMWLTARKKIDNWVLWFVVNILTVYLYFVQDLNFLAILYLVYIGLAVWGFVEWRRSMLESQDESPASSEV